MPTYLLLEGNAAGFAGESFIALDVTLDVTPTFTSRVSKHPVERDSELSDHIVNENPTFAISGFISNAPLVGQVNKQSLVDSSSPLDPEAPTYDAQRGQRAYNALIKIRADRVPFSIVTDFAVYHNCFFTSLTLPRSVENAEGIMIEASLEQLRIVDTDSTDIVVTNVAAAKQEDSSGTTSSSTPKKTPKKRSRTAVVLDAQTSD